MHHDHLMAAGNERVGAEHGLHLLHFYSDEQDLAQAVVRRIIEALRSGGTAFAAAPAAHLRVIDAELHRAGIDVAAVRDAGSYITDDPEPVARRVITNGRLDRAELDVAADQWIETITKSRAPLFMYGEFSPRLWASGIIDAALEMEARTDEIVKQHDVTVMCGYPSKVLLDGGDLDDLRKLCGHHTHLTSLPWIP